MRSQALDGAKRNWVNFAGTIFAYFPLTAEA